jgi:tRNA G18 (ribose-2'-O)-methylase SpoU
MGAVFQLQLIQSTDLVVDLQAFSERHDIELLATVLDPTAETLSTATRQNRMALLFGNEGHGLSDSWISSCHRRVTLPMAGNTDSLNAASASAVFLYHFTHVAAHLKSNSAASAD